MGFCGGGNASKEEKAAQAAQAKLGDQMTQQAQQIMGFGTQVFNDLVSAFAPIVAAGPHQEGFSLAQMAELKSRAVTQTGVAARNAMTAVKQAGAAYGGGNVPLPGGAQIGAEIGVANAASQSGAAQLSDIDVQSKELGMKNFYSAAGVLGGAPGASFGVANQAGSVASGAWANAAQTSEDMTKVQNQPGWGLSLLSAASSLGGAAMGAWCPAEGSLYLMDDGSERPVEYLSVKDKISGIDGEAQTIEEILSGYTEVICVVTANGFVTRNSPTHAFALPKGGFTVAAKSFGKPIITAAGPSVVVGIERAGWVKVYNVITDGSHTYRADGVWALGVGEAERNTSMSTWSKIGDSLLQYMQEV